MTVIHVLWSNKVINKSLQELKMLHCTCSAIIHRFVKQNMYMVAQSNKAFFLQPQKKDFNLMFELEKARP